MDSNVSVMFKEISMIAIPLVIGFGTLAVGYVLRKILFKSIHRWSQNTKTRIDDIVVDSINTPSILWLIILGIYAGVTFSVLPEKIVLVIGKIIFVLGAVSLTLVLANFTSKNPCQLKHFSLPDYLQLKAILPGETKLYAPI